jgi:hypothetical protein
MGPPKLRFRPPDLKATPVVTRVQYDGPHGPATGEARGGTSGPPEEVALAVVCETLVTLYDMTKILGRLTEGL